MDRSTVRPWATTGKKHKNERRKKLPLLPGIGSGARGKDAHHPHCHSTVFIGEPAHYPHCYYSIIIEEPLTRLLGNDERLSGLTIGEQHEQKVRQFANGNDTAAMLERYQHLMKLFETINIWEATAPEWRTTKLTAWLSAGLSAWSWQFELSGW